ncbi:hypothetical protein BS78_08G058600 [Paspalum vaginatum]|nr:hypothetical protein BS78_08G058600 [Paspalum vaginatum]
MPMSLASPNLSISPAFLLPLPRHPGAPWLPVIRRCLLPFPFASMPCLYLSHAVAVDPTHQDEEEMAHGGDLCLLCRHWQCASSSSAVADLEGTRERRERGYSAVRASRRRRRTGRAASRARGRSGGLSPS